MKPRKHLLATFSALLIAALLVACVSPAVAPIPTPVPPTATPTATDTDTRAAHARADAYRRGNSYPAAPASPPPEGLRPDAPEFARHGPFWVGYKSLVIGGGSDRPLEAGLWYPALSPKGAKEEITYPIKLNIPLGPIDALLVAYGHALQDAEADPSGGPYPLVILSHGFAANAVWYTNLIEHYASH